MNNSIDLTTFLIYTRDAILYDPETGVIKLVTLIKKQIARVPGKDSAATSK